MNKVPFNKNQYTTKQNAAASLSGWMSWLNEQQGKAGSNLLQRVEEAKKECSNGVEYLLEVRSLVATALRG